MKKRVLALLLAVSLTAGLGGESVCAAPAPGNEQEVMTSLKGADREREESITQKSYGAGNSMIDAESIPLNAARNGSITDTNKKDFYKITVPSSSSVQLNLKFTSYMEYVDLRIYNEKEEYILDSHLERDSDTSQTVNNYTIYLNPGVYYVGVIAKCKHYYNWDGCTGNYRFSLSYTQLKNLDLKPDDTLETAHAIPLTTSFTGVLAEDENSDFYRVNVTSPGIIECRFTAYMYKAYIRIFDREGEELYYDCPGWNPSIGYSTNVYQFPLEKGTYYIQIADYYNYSVGKYTISNRFINVASNETERNDTMQTADPISMNQKITGLLSLDEKSDMYKVKISKSGNVPIMLKAEMSWVYLNLYDSRGNQIARQGPYWNEALGYSNNTYTYKLNAGTYYVQILANGGVRGKYQLQVGKKTSKTNISKASVSSIKNKAYTGKAIKPSVTVKYNGKTLKKNKDYTVSYKNNKKMGTASVIISGKGNYTGSKKVTFKIVPKKVKLSSVKNTGKRTVTIKWKKDGKVSGYEIYRSTKKSSGYKKIKTITKNKTVSFKNKKLSKGKTYYYKVKAYKKAGNKKYYGSYSSVKSVKIKK